MAGSETEDALEALAALPTLAHPTADPSGERVAFYYDENLAAPLFVIHGVNDRRVPVSQARAFRDALDEYGDTEGENGDYKYAELGEEGHASTDIDQKVRLVRLLSAFLDRRLEV